MGAGRPSIYSEEVADRICSLLAEGIGLRAICRRDYFPPRQTVLDWLNREDLQDFRSKYARAREAQADYLDEEMQAVSDAATPEDVQVAKLRVGTMQWRAAKLAPKKYGEKLEIAGDPNNPIITQRNYSADDINTLKAYFEATKLPKAVEPLTIEHKAVYVEDED